LPSPAVPSHPPSGCFAATTSAWSSANDSSRQQFSARNVGRAKAAELATYAVEKDLPLVELVK
jgi:hypothetical protein